MDILTLAMAKAKVDKLKKSGGAGYSEDTEKVLLDGVFDTYEFSSFYMIEVEILAVGAGDEVTINWNGKQYTCVVFELDGVVGFGNLSIVEEADDTGEPFLYALSFDDKGNESGVFATTDTGTIAVRVTATTETIHPIDPKYLPVVVLNTVPTIGGAELTAEESAQMDIAVANERPIIVRFEGDAVMVVVCDFVKGIFSDVGDFVGNSGLGKFLIMHNDEGKWIVQSSQ